MQAKDRIIRIDIQLEKLRELLGKEETDAKYVESWVCTLEALRSRILEAESKPEKSEGGGDSRRQELNDLDLRIEKLREEIANGKPCSETALTLFIEDREKLIAEIAEMETAGAVDSDDGPAPKGKSARAKQNAENLAKISGEIAALGERLKAQVEKSKKLSSDTDHLLKKAKKTGGGNQTNSK